MACEGYLILQRQVLCDLRQAGPIAKLVYLECLERANYRAVGDVPRGSFLSSRERLSLDIGISEKQLRTALDKLKKLSLIGQEKGQGRAKRAAKIIVLNYDVIVSSGANERAKEGPGVNKGLRRSPGVGVSPAVVDVVSPVVEVKHQEATQKTASPPTPRSALGRPRKGYNAQPFWREMVAFIESSYEAKKKAKLCWSQGKFKQLADMALAHECSGIAGLWRLYLEGHHPKAVEAAFGFQDFVWLEPNLVDDKRWKQYKAEFEKKWTTDDGAETLAKVTAMIREGAKGITGGLIRASELINPAAFSQRAKTDAELIAERRSARKEVAV